MKAFEKIRGRWIKLATRISYAFGIVTIVLPARAFAAVEGALPWTSRSRLCKLICRVQLLIQSRRRPSLGRD